MLVSRVLLGVHFPSDVLAGAAIGAASATTVRSVGRRLAGWRRDVS